MYNQRVSSINSIKRIQYLERKTTIIALFQFYAVDAYIQCGSLENENLQKSL